MSFLLKGKKEDLLELATELRLEATVVMTKPMLKNLITKSAGEVTTSPIDGAAIEYMRHPPEWWVFEAEARAAENETDSGFTGPRSRFGQRGGQ
ncbi:hypothetical protein TNCT_374061 [Trichonephila clavata]|uniref:Uncharacterized protein n=1 Tax=Trichonephila clavata TaxID=2740835 RepID=A0A8X6JZN3_TRICU|nr:hypothetical protein TNCT_374061 [Trichonephila clavata]